MMHCPTFGSLTSLKYLKTCFQICQDIFKISQDIYQMYQDIDEMAQTFLKSGMALVSGCPKHCPTFGSLIEHSPHLHKHTYIHNPEVDIAEGAAAAAHARTREGNFWIFASEASSSSNIYLGFCQIKKQAIFASEAAAASLIQEGHSAGCIHTCSASSPPKLQQCLMNLSGIGEEVLKTHSAAVHFGFGALHWRTHVLCSTLYYLPKHDWICCNRS